MMEYINRKKELMVELANGIDIWTSTPNILCSGLIGNQWREGRWQI